MGKKIGLLPWQVAFTYIGAVIGAGFASGQEILKFFAAFGLSGLAGTVVAGSCFAGLGFFIIHSAYKYQVVSYEKYSGYIFGKWANRIVSALIAVFLLAGLAVMLVAGGSLFHQLFGLPLWVGFFLTALTSYLILNLGIGGILWFNTFKVPCLIFMSMWVALHGIAAAAATPQTAVAGPKMLVNSWLVAAVIYVAYNLVLGLVILVPLSYTVPRGGAVGAVGGGLILGLLAFVMCLCLLQQDARITETGIPMLALAWKISARSGLIYSLLLWGEILSTSLSAGCGLLQYWGGKTTLPRPVLILLLYLPTLPFLGWQLGKAVETIYPLLGYLGLIMLLAILIKIKNWNK